MKGYHIQKTPIEERAVAIAEYIVKNKATVRQAAGQFGVSKSTVHKDVTERLLRINPSLAAKARKILGPDSIIGVTAKTVEQALKAQAEGADYLGSGAVFGTTTKSDAKPMDIDTMNAISDSLDIPVVAIGGINNHNVMKLSGSRIAGIAVVSGIFDNEDIKGAAQSLRAKALNIISGR